MSSVRKSVSNSMNKMRTIMNLKTRTIIFISCLSSVMLFGQDGQKENKLHLIPYPMQVTLLPGTIDLKDDVQIAVSPSHREDEFAARQLIIEFRNKIGGNPVLIDDAATAVIKLSRSKGETTGKEGYFLRVRSDEIEIIAGSAAGIFYGVQTLRQLIRANLNADSSLSCLEIVDKPALKYRGWQDDISRGPIPKLDFLKRQIRTLSEYKLNCMTLYTEHVFKLSKHPIIAPADGITAEEIKELTAFAKDYHVEVIGNFQSFGHFKHILKHPEYAHLAETANVLSPALEASYDFLADAYAEVAPAYESRLFNINCDETFGLGTGPARAMLDSLGKEGLYACHINRIADLLKPYGKRMMMWGDIAEEYPAIIPRLPADLIVLPWAYHAAESFESYILPFTKMGLDFMVCPGVSCWGRIYPDFETAIINISNFVRDGVKHGCLGMLNTTWDDDGENLANYNWYPLIWGAEISWNPILPVELSEMNALRNSRQDSFNKAFDPLFFRIKGAGFGQLMGQLSQLDKHKASGGLKDSEFWKSLTELNIKKQLSASSLLTEASGLAAKLSALAGLVRQNRDVVESAAFAAARVKFMAEKIELAADLGCKVQAPAEIQLRARLKKMEQDVVKLKLEYKRLWEMENRAWWLDVNLQKYEKLETNIRQMADYIFILPDTDTFSCQRRVNLRPLFSAEKIYYTIDGSDPTEYSQLFSGPFFVKKSSLVRARPVVNGKPGLISQQHILVYDGWVMRIDARYPRAKEYSAEGMIGLFDGIHGTVNFHKGGYQGYLKNNFDVVIELKRVRKISTIETGFLQDSRSWILYPQWVEYSVSLDGEFYSDVVRIENKVDPAFEGGMKQIFKADMGGMRGKYIRIVAKNTGQLPDWHKSAGGDAWLFVDEIEIK